MSFVIIIIILLSVFMNSCDNPLTKEQEQDCTIDLGGFYDDCEICSGGITNHVANSDKDCEGECFGSASLDECCDDNETQDCAGVCGGDSETNECGNCYSDSEIDDNLETGQDLCGICFGDNTSCNKGLLTKPIWEFKQIQFWNNDNCHGNPYYTMNDNMCLDSGVCFNYTLDFTDKKEDFGNLIFEQNIHSNNILYQRNGIWNIINAELCLSYCLFYDIDNSEVCDEYDYNTENWECYNSIDFQNNYFDCVSDISLCDNNSAELLFSDETQGVCSKEILDTEIQNNTEMNLISSEDINMFPLHIKNIFLYFQNNFDK